MKLLVCGNSSFLPRKGIDEASLPQNINRDLVDAAVGEHVDVEVRIAWPTEKLPGVVERWVTEYEPDAVLFIVNEFWFNYQSVPALVSRRFGPVGKPIATIGGRLGRNPRLAYNRGFQAFRRFAEKKVGGEANFEPEDVIRVVQDSLRSIIRSEGAVPIVLGPMGNVTTITDPEFLARSEQRRMQVHLAIKQFCAGAHIEYWGLDSLQAQGRISNVSRLPDGVHADAQSLRRGVAHWQPHLVMFLRKIREERDAATQRPL